MYCLLQWLPTDPLSTASWPPTLHAAYVRQPWLACICTSPLRTHDMIRNLPHAPSLSISSPVTFYPIQCLNTTALMHCSAVAVLLVIVMLPKKRHARSIVILASTAKRLVDRGLQRRIRIGASLKLRRVDEAAALTSEEVRLVHIGQERVAFLDVALTLYRVESGRQCLCFANGACQGR